jgi:hypothetical protein
LGKLKQGLKQFNTKFLQVLRVEVDYNAFALFLLRAVETLLGALQTVGKLRSFLLCPVPGAILFPVLVGFEAARMEPEHLCGQVNHFRQRSNFLVPLRFNLGRTTGSVHEGTSLHTVVVHIYKAEQVVLQIGDKLLHCSDFRNQLFVDLLVTQVFIFLFLL